MSRSRTPVYITILYILQLILVPKCDAMYARGTHTRMMKRLVTLIRELYLDAEAKVESIQYMRRHYSKDNSYQMAELIYFIRALYKKMVRKFTAEMNGKKFIMGYEQDDAVARRVAEITDTNRRQMHIDNLVQMVIEYDNTDPSGIIYGRRAADENLPIEITSGLKIQKNPDQVHPNRTLENQKQIDRMKIRNKQMRLKLLQSFGKRNLSRDELILESGFDSDKN